MNNSRDKRTFDIVIWGATGFTGRLVADYLASHYGIEKTLRWAIAGRDKARLDNVKRSLGANAESLPAIVADSFDGELLRAMTSQCRVIVSTVGPYAKYGSALVAACVDTGTDYCDLAGEAQWIREMIDKHHANAEQKGARIVHCCGFDSVPMDIGVWFLQQQAIARSGTFCKSIATLVKATKGGPSGGTIASLINVIKASRTNREAARTLADPYGLNPAGERDGPDLRDQRNVRFDSFANSWTAPFVMAGINTKIVRRSHALLGYPYGRDFRYREAVMTGNGVSGRLKAVTISSALAALLVGASYRHSRNFLERFVLPKPGDGPDANTRASGFFDLRLFGELPNGTPLIARVKGDRDPGYGSTSKMLGECAVCLAIDALSVSGGVHTPASAMAEPLIERLRANAGLSFEIVG